MEFETEKGPVTLTKIEQAEGLTANRAELVTIREALKRLKEKCFLLLYTESVYVAAAISQNWIQQWQDSGWKNAKGQEVANKAEWVEVLNLLKAHAYEVKLKEQNTYREWLQKEVEAVGDKSLRLPAT